MTGRTKSHYKIGDKPGEGGMGIVFRGHITKLAGIPANQISQVGTVINPTTAEG